MNTPTISPKTIAVIDDDVHIGNLLEEVLTGEGYKVIRAYSGTEALYLLEKQCPDLVLLDLMLPGLSGEQLLPQIKKLPVIILSAKADVQDKVSLLLDGAADYITKPFETPELLARITVQLRRASTADRQVMSCGALTMNTDSHEVTVSGHAVHLTKTEYAILKLLLQNPRQVIAKSVILERISADTPDGVESSLKVHVSNLRRKLREADGHDYIESVWGIGFKLSHLK